MRSMESKRKKAARHRPQRANSYHHGDLAAALIEAAEAVITERGLEGFTLRECARRAGVSHAAPAHHFRDAKGLLTAVAAVGFERLTEAQKKARAAEPKSRNRLLGVALGYLEFAFSHPTQFQLMFQQGLLDQEDERYRAASRAAFAVYIETYAEVYGFKFREDIEKISHPSVLREWAMVHGLATLTVQGQFGPARSDTDVARIKKLTRAALEDAQKYGLPLE